MPTQWWPSLGCGIYSSSASIMNMTASGGTIIMDNSDLSIDGRLICTTGSAETPAIQFSNDTSRGGIYSSAQSVIDVNVGSTGTFAVHSVLSATTLVTNIAASSAVTPGSSTGYAEGQFVFTAGESTASLAIRSGFTIYVFVTSYSTSTLG